MSKDLSYYRALPYALRVDRFVEPEDGAEYYRATFVQLPQVIGIHKDRLLAINLAKELFDDYVEAQLAWSEEVPEPDAPRTRKRGGLFRFTLQPKGAQRTGASWSSAKSDEPADATAADFARAG